MGRLKHGNSTTLIGEVRSMHVYMYLEISVHVCMHSIQSNIPTAVCLSVCLFVCLSVVLRLAREYSAHLETSTLLMNGCKEYS